jgi:hypothetical protein
MRIGREVVMACDICKNEIAMDAIRDATKYMGEVKYCPMCGEKLVGEMTFIQWVQGFLNQQLDHLRNTIYDETGKPMLLDRKPSTPKQPDVLSPTKPRDMSFDLDKIDISKELEMLAEYERHNKANDVMDGIGKFFSQPKVAINPLVYELFEQFCEDQEDLEDDEQL